ncbi:MAG: KpsF/GutQ family sugar-phosphate isomerase [Chlamydiota bacterium]
MIGTLLQHQKQYIDQFFDQIDLDQAAEILAKLYNTKGTLVFTGVGKSGIIANKLAMTFLSTGTKALYLPSTDAMHGDLGLLDQDDVLILLSKSGNTEELIRLLPFAKNKKVWTIALVSNRSGKLYEQCDLSAYLPVEKELCPFDLAPTTSTEVQLMYGHLLAVAMMKKKKFTRGDFAKNHPAGSIGKKLSLTVEDVMRKGEELPLCSFGEKLLHLLCRLSEKKSGCLFITNERRELLGIFTDGDLRRTVEMFGHQALEKPIEEVMTTSPRFTTKAVLAVSALQKMEEKVDGGITVMPVLEEGRLIGMVRLHDILQAL